MSEPTPSEAEYDAITDAAAHWCMRLHASDCSSAERLAFEQWRDADPLHAFEFEAMQDSWEVAAQLPRLTPPQVVTSPVRRRHWPAYGVVAAISLACLSIAAYTGWQLGWLPNAYEHYQASNRLQRVTLPDGSKVELNLGTELTYSNYKDQRRVTLDKGEAFFKVSHDSSHPLVVRAAEGRIRVTGTQFNVWMYQDQVRVTMLEGSVLVTSKGTLPGDGLRLAPGMQARYTAGDFSPQVSQSDANDSSLAWRTGKLVLDNLPLEDALPLINRYLAKPVMLADAATGRIRIGGIYDTREVRNILSSLPKVLPVYLTRNKDGNPVLNSIPHQPAKP